MQHVSNIAGTCHRVCLGEANLIDRLSADVSQALCIAEGTAGLHVTREARGMSSDGFGRPIVECER